MWPDDPQGSMVPILEASLEAAKARHPSGKAPDMLTLADRCDACPAAAAYHLGKGWIEGQTLSSTGELLFCIHHFRKNYPVMADRGWVILFANPDQPEGTS